MSAIEYIAKLEAEAKWFGGNSFLGEVNVFSSDFNCCGSNS